MSGRSHRIHLTQVKFRAKVQAFHREPKPFRCFAFFITSRARGGISDVLTIMTADCCESAQIKIISITSLVLAVFCRDFTIGPAAKTTVSSHNSPTGEAGDWVGEG